MKQLLSIEYSKLRKLNTLRVILLIYFAIVPLWMYFMGFAITNVFGKALPILPTSDELYSFPEIWRFVTYSASWFNLLVGVAVVVITTNEIHYRTMKQNVIDGLSKQQVILSKFLVVFAISVIVTLYTALVGFLIGGFYSGFGGAFQNIHYVPTYFLQTLGYFSFAFFFAVLVKRPALAIIFFIISFIVEFIIGIILEVAVSDVPYQFFPLNIFSKLTPIPFFEQFLKAQEAQQKKDFWVMPDWMMYSLVCFYILVFFLIAYRVLKRRDL
jgi:ABC-2 type transport system permease protein